MLFAGPDGAGWCADHAGYAAYRVAPDGDVTDPDGQVLAALGIGPAGAVLVRPDGVLAWRSGPDDAPGAAAAGAALRTLLQPA